MAMGEINDSLDQIDAKMLELTAIIQRRSTYDPKTQIVISREAGKGLQIAMTRLSWLDLNGLKNREEAAQLELRAAMESNKGKTE